MRLYERTLLYYSTAWIKCIHDNTSIPYCYTSVHVFGYVNFASIPSPRNPSHNDRPSASDISGEFCKSERILLSWKKENIVSPSAQVLGGPLSDGEELYKDLQSIYNDPYYY